MPHRVHPHQTPLALIDDRERALNDAATRVVAHRDELRVERPEPAAQRVEHGQLATQRRVLVAGAILSDAEVVLPVGQARELAIERLARAVACVRGLVATAGRARHLVPRRRGRRRDVDRQRVGAQGIRGHRTGAGGRARHQRRDVAGGMGGEIRGLGRQLHRQRVGRNTVEEETVRDGGSRLPRRPQRVEVAAGEQLLERLSTPRPLRRDRLVATARGIPARRVQVARRERQRHLAAAGIGRVAREHRFEDATALGRLAALERDQAAHVAGSRGVAARDRHRLEQRPRIFVARHHTCGAAQDRGARQVAAERRYRIRGREPRELGVDVLPRCLEREHAHVVGEKRRGGVRARGEAQRILGVAAFEQQARGQRVRGADAGIARGRAWVERVRGRRPTRRSDFAGVEQPLVREPLRVRRPSSPRRHVAREDREALAAPELEVRLTEQERGAVRVGERRVGREVDGLEVLDDAGVITAALFERGAAEMQRVPPHPAIRRPHPACGVGSHSRRRRRIRHRGSRGRRMGRGPSRLRRNGDEDDGDGPGQGRRNRNGRARSHGAGAHSATARISAS